MKQHMEQSEKDYVIRNCKAITQELQGQQYCYGYLFEKATKIVEALKDNQAREEAIAKAEA